MYTALHELTKIWASGKCVLVHVCADACKRDLPLAKQRMSDGGEVLWPEDRYHDSALHIRSSLTVLEEMLS